MQTPWNTHLFQMCFFFRICKPCFPLMFITDVDKFLQFFHHILLSGDFIGENITEYS